MFPWRRSRAAGLVLFALTVPGAAVAQESGGDEWNDPATLELVRRGIARRVATVQDSTLRTYTARGNGYVYFVLDAPRADTENLVRTDQVAVDVFWRTPGEVRQHVVGMRERRELPVTGLYYYLDRFTVIQDDFGESIVIADGDNVSDVRHPVGPGAESWYDYRLADSLTLRLPGLPDPVTVHEIEVRPRDPERPAVIGKVFLERETGALVRMNFTFTPSAYVDPRLDYINVTFENGLWNGRYWLPHEQRLEIRREMPELDLPFGTVIRTRMRVGDYRFNEPVPDWLFAGRLPVTMAPRAERENFEFEQPIDAEWRLEGLGRPADVDEIRSAARSIVRERTLSGVPAGRLAIRSASDLFRYDRAEGPTLGLGLGFRPDATVSARLHGGWAFGARHPLVRLDVSANGRASVETSVYVNRNREAGGHPSTSGAANTLSALFLGDDWSDPFYTSGGSIDASVPLAGTWSVRSSLRAERQRSAELTTTYSIAGDDGESVRPVLEIDRGTLLAGEVAIRREVPSTAGGWWAQAGLSAGRLARTGGPLAFAWSTLDGGYVWSDSWRRARVDLTGAAGWSLGDLPRQELRWFGGRGTLPGHDYRAYAGDRYASVGVVASADLLHPWIRGRLGASVAWSAVSSSGRRAAELLATDGSDGPKASLGAGVGLFYDLLRIDVARGIGGSGRTRIIVEFPPDFWDFL